MPGGRPTKFNSKMQDAIKKMAKLGLTDKQMADVLDITEQTINNWKKARPKFFESLKDWKAEADIVIEQSLRDRAKGWTDSTGKEYPPDPTSMIFWLKNRQPEKWRDKQDLAVTGDLSITIVKFGGTDADNDT